jgi:hypothetical protein
MPKKPSYSLNQECADGRGVVLHTSSLGAVIGLGAGFSSLLEPGVIPEVSWPLFQNLTLIGVLGLVQGAILGLILSGFFAKFVRVSGQKSSTANRTKTARHSKLSRSQTKTDEVFPVGDVVYGT